MKLQLRELKATRPTMPSQGLGPRQSVLPLLISFLFSHIVLEPSSPSLSVAPSSHPPPSPILSLPIILFPPLFFSPVSPSHLSSWSLFISRASAPYLAPWESARAIRAAREEVLIPVSRYGASLLSRLRDRSA